MTITDDPNDPRLRQGADPIPNLGQAPVYLVLPKAERDKGFIRPLRRTYVHMRDEGEVSTRKTDFIYDKSTAGCGGVATSMGLALSETYARDPKFYGYTFCTGCRTHRPVSEFDWDDGTVVGS